MTDTVTAESIIFITWAFYTTRFHYLEYDYKLSNGRTVIDDIYYALDRGVEGAALMEALWADLKGQDGIDDDYHEYARSHFAWYSEEADKKRQDVYEAISDASDIDYRYQRAEDGDDEFTIPPEDETSNN